MAVTEQTPIQAYTANGSTTVFAFGFQVLQATDLLVSLDGVLQVGYTVAGIGSQVGGTVTFSVAPGSGVRVLLYRDIPLNRATDYQNNGDLLAAVVNQDFDRIWLALQEMQSQTLRFDVNVVGDVPVAGFTPTQLASAVAAAYAAGSTADAVTYLPGGTGAVATTTQNRLRREVWVEDFGAAPAATAAANYAAFTAAILYVGAAGGGVIRVGRGVYQLSATVILAYKNVALVGDWGSGDGNVDSGGTQLVATHSAGPVLRVQELGCLVESLVIDSSAGRYAGAAGSNYGLLIEALDIVGGSVQRTTVRDVRITNQPNHGLLAIGKMVSSKLDMVTVDNVNGHGFAINAGGITSRTNLARPGQIDLLNCWASRCGGHGLLVGNALVILGSQPLTDAREKLERPYRVNVSNFESFYNCIIPGNCIGLYDWYIWGENCQFESSACGGESSLGVDDHSGLYVAGQNNTFRNHRFVNTNPRPADVIDRAAIGGPASIITTDILFEFLYIDTSLRAPGFYNPAISVAATCQNVSVNASTRNTDVGTLMSTTSVNFAFDSKGIRRFDGAYVAGGFASTPIAVTLTDDQAGYFQFPAAGSRGIMSIAGNTSTAFGAVVHFRVGDGSNFCVAMGVSGTVVVGTGTQVTGAAGGTDNALNITADSATNRLYVKNRTAGTRAYEITLLCSRDTVAPFVTV